MMHPKRPRWQASLALVFCAAFSTQTFGTQPQSLNIKPTDVLAVMEQVADWQLSHPAKYSPSDWTQAVGYVGIMALSRISASPRFREAMRRTSESNEWKLGPSPYLADDDAVGQLYEELYFRDQDPRMIKPMREQFDRILAHRKDANLQFTSSNARDKWSWCDSLFMSPPALVRLYAATGEKKYLDFMVKQWWKTSDYLYDKDEQLFFRDSRYFHKRGPNGKKIFWSRGNGWVMAGLVRVLQYLPNYHPARARFVQQFREMADKIVTLQQPDGFWRASLLDAYGYPLQETSGTALFTYALAWGVNNDLLSRNVVNREKMMPAVINGWKALASSVISDGRLTHVQPIGEDPRRFDENHTDVYGVGAFLLAGSEVYQMVSGKIIPTVAPLSRERITQVAAWLPEQPEGPGRPISDRVFWNRFGMQIGNREVIDQAITLLKMQLPAAQDDLYLEYSRSGNLAHWENIELHQRRDRLVMLVLAECIESKGRFLPAIEQLLAELCKERTWVDPAHDPKLDNFNNKTIEIELTSSLLAWNLAMTDYLLGERLSRTNRDELQDNLRRRIFDPYRAMVRNERQRMWWMTAPMNWNAVCLAGVTGAALIELPTREERAEFVAAAELYSQALLAGFGPDGYTREGLGYWNYGFGRYTLLSETLRSATHGQMDLLLRPEARMPAWFGSRMEIVNGVSPAFGDCSVFEKPLVPLTRLLTQKFNSEKGNEHVKIGQTLDYWHGAALAEVMIYKLAVNSGTSTALRLPIRDYFENAGVLISRPRNVEGIGVAIKGNAFVEAHTHQDLGSYVVVSGKRAVLLDPGTETYTARTFSNQRSESKFINSFGHPVPIVAGLLQIGGSSKSVVVKAEFSESADKLALDLTAAYAMRAPNGKLRVMRLDGTTTETESGPPLKNLTRTFQYSREGRGSLRVTDQVSFTKPELFGTAMITLGTWQRQPDGSIIVCDAGEALRVEIDTGGNAFSIDAESIGEGADFEDSPVVKPTRIGINLIEPVMNATVRITITPI